MSGNAAIAPANKRLSLLDFIDDYWYKYLLIEFIALKNRNKDGIIRKVRENERYLERCAMAGKSKNKT
jgi:hypothetical protein